MTGVAPPQLSVCIPTYNRAFLLKRSLAALADAVAARGLGGRVEVCVSDNASTDDTPAVIAAAVDAHPHIRWNVWRNPTNIGGVANIFRVADGATGVYLSVTGDDDVVQPDGLSGLVSATETGAVLLIVNSYAGLGRWVRQQSIGDGTRRWFHRWPDVNHRLGVFHASFLGNLVFRRDVYHRHRRNEFMANAYPHTLVAAAAMQDNPALFVNLTLYSVDDSARTWRALQPRYSCYDMALVQSADGLVGASWRAVSAAYAPLVRTVPRTVYNGHIDPRAGVRPAELIAAYRRSVMFQIMAVGLWAAATVCPSSLLGRLLNRRTDRYTEG